LLRNADRVETMAIRACDCGLYRGDSSRVLVRGTFGHPSGDLLPLPNSNRRAHDQNRQDKRSRAMKAKIGDWFVLKGRTVEQSDRRGLITEVHGADGAPPYVVRWLDTGHVATVVPGPDAIIVTPAEQEAADERARSRVASVQTAIAHQHPSK